MTNEIKFRQNIEDYLLNKSSEEINQEIEEKILTDDEFYDFFLTVECDLYEKYIEGDYPPSEKESFEKYFLVHQQRQEDLWVTQVLKEKAKNIKPFKESSKSTKSTVWSFNFRKFFPILATSFTILSLIIGGFIWWNTQDFDLNKGLTALKDSYKPERPLQSRVSDFEYSPFVQTRGNNEKDTANLRIWIIFYSLK